MCGEYPTLQSFRGIGLQVKENPESLEIVLDYDCCFKY